MESERDKGRPVCVELLLISNRKQRQMYFTLAGVNTCQSQLPAPHSVPGCNVKCCQEGHSNLFLWSLVFGVTSSQR